MKNTLYAIVIILFVSVKLLAQGQPILEKGLKDYI